LSVADGRLCIADTNDHAVRFCDPEGEVRTMEGSD
jgi:hypothetical protein